MFAFTFPKVGQRCSAISSKAMGLRLFEALQNYANHFGPGIMTSPTRELVIFPERERPVITETDLEDNFPLIKEMALCCFEHVSQHTDMTSKEVPVLADFEAWCDFVFLRKRSQNKNLFVD